MVYSHCLTFCCCALQRMSRPFLQTLHEERVDVVGAVCRCGTWSQKGFTRGFTQQAENHGGVIEAWVLSAPCTCCLTSCVAILQWICVIHAAWIWAPEATVISATHLDSVLLDRYRYSVRDMQCQALGLTASTQRLLASSMVLCPCSSNARPAVPPAPAISAAEASRIVAWLQPLSRR